MFLRHSILYLFGRGVPGIIGFATIVVYTRLLSPEAYGQYALVVTTAILVNAILYQWLNASLLRFLPQHRDNPTDLLYVLLCGFISVSLLTGIAGLGLTLMSGAPEWDRLIFFSIVLVWAQAWFTINQDLSRGRLMPVHYGIMSSLRAAISLGLGAVLVLLGYGTDGALIGFISGYVVLGLLSSSGQWGSAWKRRLEYKLVKKVLVYGLPLTASFALNAIIYSTDRFMLAGLINESATGLYVAGQGLPQQTIGASMQMINLAAYPLIVHALEQGGADAASAQLRKTLTLLLGIGLPVAGGFILLAPEIAGIFLGQGFQSAAVILIPWAALAALLSGLRAYYFDLAFYLGRRTHLQVIVMVFSAVVNVILNLRFIPAYGLAGAVYASVVAHAVGITLSALLGRRIFRLPAPYGDVVKLLFATCAMTGVLLLMPHEEGMPGLVLSVGAAGSVYLGCVILMNAGNVRNTLTRILGRREYRYRTHTN